MAIQTNFPAVKPTLLLDFANTKKLDPRITFTRTTTATYYDGVTTAKAEENLLLQSQAFNNASWANQNTTETDNAATAPDGTSTAATLNDGAATGAHDIGETFSGTSGVTYTLSAFFKNVNRQYVILACSASPNSWASAKFDLTAGTAGSTSASGSGWSTTSSSITSVGNSWYRCTITFVSGSTGTLTARLGMATDGTTFTAGQRGLESYTGTNATIEIWGAQLEQRSSVTAYTATTTQPITNYIPVLLTAASGVARFDHNPTTDESLGLLVEEQRTNLLTYSADFSNAAWTKSGSNITANTIVAPDGALTGDKLVEDTATSTHRCYQTVSGTTNTNSYTGSFYAKKGERTKISYAMVEGATFSRQVYCMFDLDAGTAGSVNVLNGATGSASITSVGNGWYRCVITATLGGTDTAIFNNLRLVTGTDTINYTGNGYSGIYIWGAQIEAGAFPTSYIATTAATVTRNADIASMTGSNFTSWYNQGEGAIYTELSSLGSLTAAQGGTLSKYPAPFIIESGSTDTYLNWYGAQADLGIGSTYSNIGNVPAGSNKFVVSFSTTAGQAASSLNGAAAVSRSGALIGTATRLGVGCNPDNPTGSCLNGTIRKLAYYPTRLTNANLQALTS